MKKPNIITDILDKLLDYHPNTDLPNLVFCMSESQFKDSRLIQRKYKGFNIVVFKDWFAKQNITFGGSPLLFKDKSIGNEVEDIKIFKPKIESISKEKFKALFYGKEKTN